MKKLMIALAAAFVAVCSHAAALNWSIQNVKTDDGKTAGTGNAIWLVVTSYTGALDLTVDSEAKIQGLLKNNGVTDASALMAVAGTVGANGLVAGPTGLSGFSKDEILSGYAIVFNNADAGKATKFAVLEPTAASYTWANSTAPVNMLFGDKSAATASGNWVSIAPEPTSGLLLLIGMAGLALRRRRA